MSKFDNFRENDSKSFVKTILKV